jgi:hypothetical protein
MTEGNYSNVGHRGLIYKGLGAMNPCDNYPSSSSSPPKEGMLRIFP